MSKNEEEEVGEGQVERKLLNISSGEQIKLVKKQRV